MLDFDKIKQEGLTLDLQAVADRGYSALSPDDYYRLKTYGVCTQRHEGYFMIRVRVPHGRCDADQLRTLADAADRHANGWLHVTTRQDVQLHSVKLDDVPALLSELEAVGLTTRSSCGHTFRNIMGCHRAGTCPNERTNVRPWVDLVSRFVTDHADRFNTTMPSRLNVFFGSCDTCMEHLQINDIGLRAVSTPEGGGIAFELWLGGSLGRATPTVAVRYPALIPPAEVLPTVFAVAELHATCSNRHPYQGRLKYTLAKLGADVFFDHLGQKISEVQETKDFSIYNLPHDQGAEPRQPEQNAIPADDLPPGCEPQAEPGAFRVRGMITRGDLTSRQFRGLADLVETCSERWLQWTPQQNVEVPNVRREHLETVAERLRALGIRPGADRTLGDVLTCPGTEYCKLAITASPVAAATLQSHLPDELSDDPLIRQVRIHISGCMNSCAQHQVADIGLSGSMTAHRQTKRFTYQLWLGAYLDARPEASRVGRVCRRGITDEQLVPLVVALLELYRDQRRPGEPFHAAVDRVGVDAFAEQLAGVCPLTPSDELVDVPMEARPTQEPLTRDRLSLPVAEMTGLPIVS